ncbi:hypothetical protein ACA910_021320 [Epithemia clementina (nom. ined.)]
MTQLVLIHGVTGVGKTSLALSLRNSVEKDGGYFVSGQFHSITPYAPGPNRTNHNHHHQHLPRQNFHNNSWAAAWNGFCAQVMARGKAAALRPLILDLVGGGEARRLVRLMPQLGPILGDDETNKDKNNHHHYQSHHDHVVKTWLPPEEERASSFISSEAILQFHSLLRLFVQAVSSFASSQQSPIVFFLDDLHWADESSLDLFGTLVNDHATHNNNNNNSQRQGGAGRGGFLFLCTMRDDADTELMERQLSCLGRTVELARIHLDVFSEAQVYTILSAILLVPANGEPNPNANNNTNNNNNKNHHLEKKQMLQVLTNTVSRQTKGNIFFILEFLRTLVEENILRFDDDNNHHQDEWNWDNDEIDIEFHDIKDVLRFRLQKLSHSTQMLLKAAACLGSTTLNAELLSKLMIVKEEEEGREEEEQQQQAPAGSRGSIVKLLEEARDRRILVYNKNNEDDCDYEDTITATNNNKSFEFAHDGVKDVVYNLIPPNEQEKFHYQLGRRLWKAYPAEKLLHTDHPGDDIMYLIVDQLIMGQSQIKSKREQSAVAKLCLQSGIMAMRQSSFRTAYTYIMQGIQLLGPQRWQDDYHLCLSIYNFAAEVAYCTAKFDSVFRFVHEIFEHAKSFHDTLHAQGTHVYALGGSGRMKEAIECDLKVLKRLGVEFPAQVHIRDVEKGLKKTKKLLKGRSMESLLRLPPLNDPTTIAAMHMLNLLLLYAFLSRMELAPHVGFKMVEITVERGVCPASCIGFSIYAMVLCSLGNEIEEGYHYGKLAMAMHEKTGAKTWLCRVSATYYGCVHGWKRPAKEAINALQRAYRVGVECGDIEFAMVNANFAVWSKFQYESLPALDRELARLEDRMKFYGQETNLKMIYPFWQLLNNLMGNARDDPTKLIGDFYDETKSDDTCLKTVQSWSCSYRSILSYFVGDYDQALNETEGYEVLITHPFGAGDVAIVIFFDALANLAQAAKNKNRRKCIARAAKGLKRISLWAKQSPLNFLGKQYLLEAELAIVKQGDHSAALAKYTSAVAVSQKAGRLMECALTNERAARHFLNAGDLETGTPFLQDAIRLYKEWGGGLKLSLLSKEFGPHVLGAVVDHV